MLGKALSLFGGGKLTSIEQNPAWCLEQWRYVQNLENVDAQIIEAQPLLTWGVTGLYFSFKEAAHTIAERKPFDLVLVDSPQYFFGRDGAIPLIYLHLAPNALIILDDARRYNEQWSIYRWIHSYPGLKLVYYDPHFGGKGLAVLQLTRQGIPKLSVLGLITNIRQMIYILFQDSKLKNLRAKELARQEEVK